MARPKRTAPPASRPTSKRASSLPPRALPVSRSAALQRGYGALIHPLAAWRSLDRGLRLAIWLLITARVGLGLVAILTLHLQRGIPMREDWSNLILGGSDFWSLLFSPWQRWDALWYQQIAAHGYHGADSTTAFFPLFPLLSRIVSLPLLGALVPAELLVTSVAYIVSMSLLYRVARLDVGPLTAALAVLLLACFPSSFFLVAPFTESLFLALTLATFWYARHDRFWLAGLAGLGAAITRPPGFLLLAPLLSLYLRRCKEQRRRPGLDLAATCVPLLGPLALFAYYRLIVGDQRSLQEMQAHWGYHFAWPWNILQDSWQAITVRGNPIELLNLLCLLSFSLLALLLIRRLPLAYTLYVWPALAVISTRHMSFSPLMSDSRYVLVLFPCFIMLATLLARRPWLAAGSLVVGILLQAALFQYYVLGGFVG